MTLLVIQAVGYFIATDFAGGGGVSFAFSAGLAGPVKKG